LKPSSSNTSLGQTMNVREISKFAAVTFVQKYHYSKVLPRINKVFLGGFDNNKLVAVMICGYGTRPLHTIRVMFPTLGTKDYIELGKLCVADEMPRNTESMFISRCIKYLKSHYPQYKLIFSWADGIIGKSGFVYQGSNFYYGGYIITEMYIDSQGNRVHPRSFQGISTTESTGRFNSRAYEVTTKAGYTKYFGYQFRYLYPLCGKKEWKMLLQTTSFNWQRGNYPKDKDCKWWKQIEKGRRIECEMPKLQGTQYKKILQDIVEVFF